MTWSRFASLFRANLRRALVIAGIVGTVLVLINHGDHLRDEPVCDRFYLKCGLSYLVPFTVSMVSAMLAGRHAAAMRTRSSD